jgi:predicted phage terminase large subunit-like protein
VKRFREGPANVEKAIKNTASQDGKACRIRLPQDPGQAGKSQAKNLIRMLAGYAVKAVPPTGAKDVRATPLAAQAEAGNVKILKAPWNEAFFDEMDVFPFGKHDDQIDGAADAFNELFEAEGSSGFFAMISEDNSKRRIAELAKLEAASAVDPSECPYPKGSLEYLQFHGLVPKS